tara:strand:+ start:298 stop:714 length:417 start_codon:yes stop_codon:yes gene_type:complete
MSHEVEDDDEQFFAEELRAKQHKEQIGLLKGIATLLNKPEKEDGVKEAVERQSKAIEKVADAILNQPKPENPEVNVELNQKEIIPLLKDIKEGNDKILTALQNKLYVDSFYVRATGNYGEDKMIDVSYKPADKITFKK